VNPKDIKCHLQWWGKHEAIFPTISFLAHQILGFARSQIKIEFFFRKQASFKPKKNVIYN
jgi:hypothetical protein